MKKGCLYGVGVGPGDPELMTVKALKCIEKCTILAVPTEDKEKSVAYQIAAGIINDIDQKACLHIPMPMTKDAALLAKSHQEGAKIVEEALSLGEDVAFLTLGDPTIYSTYMYIHQKVTEDGYDAQIISGIPSFCAAAARVGVSLGETKDQIHVIPASYAVEDAMKLPGTKILMKAGKKMAYVKAYLIQHGFQAVMIQNCGMPGERIIDVVEDMPEDPGYYTLLIIKDR